MRNLSRFIPIDGVNESLGENEGTTENGEIVVGYESNTTGSTQDVESLLNNIDKNIDNVEAELENILVGAGIKPEVIGESDTKSESKISSGNSGVYEIVSSEGIGTGITNSDSKFKVCGTNLPAKVSFWSKIKSFFRTEIAIEIPFSKGSSETGENTSGGTSWSGLKNFFSFGKK